jgi:hypothetical protein
MSGWINGFSLLFGGTNVLSRCGYSIAPAASTLSSVRMDIDASRRSRA